MHCGMPEDQSDRGTAAWRRGLARLAERPNMHVKLSGLGTFIRRNDADHVGRIIRETVGLFGAERCVFGSNFPIEKLWCSYGELIHSYRTAIAELPGAARASIMRTTAERLYRLAPSPAR
jgi:predicted TIM-barrel fold metal-dependent hydrolase